MTTTLQKRDILACLERERLALGSWSKLATKLGVVTATLTNNVANEHNWPKVSDSMWLKLAAGVNCKIQAVGWQVVETTNTRLVLNTLRAAQKEAMFMAISERAGSGKTASIRYCQEQDSEGSVFVLQCEEWTRKQFLQRLTRSVGSEWRSHDTIDHLTERVVGFFKQKSKVAQPLLVLDEADKLRPGALRFLIVLFNRLEDELGLVIAGTENLQKEIKSGVRRAAKGYDELDSRFGRSYVSLIGATYDDVERICQANGVVNLATIAAIWREAKPLPRQVQGKVLDMVDDLRRVKRLVKRERIRLGQSGEQEGATP